MKGHNLSFDHIWINLIGKIYSHIAIKTLYPWALTFCLVVHCWLMCDSLIFSRPSIESCYKYFGIPMGYASFKHAYINNFLVFNHIPSLSIDDFSYPSQFQTTILLIFWSTDLKCTLLHRPSMTLNLDTYSCRLQIFSIAFILLRTFQEKIGHSNSIYIQLHESRLFKQIQQISRTCDLSLYTCGCLKDNTFDLCWNVWLYNLIFIVVILLIFALVFFDNFKFIFVKCFNFFEFWLAWDLFSIFTLHIFHQHL